MPIKTAGIALISVIFATPFTYGQANDRERLDNALREISQLKRIVSEQDRRIQKLEEALASLRNNGDQTLHSVTEAQPEPSQQGLKPWQSPPAWHKIQTGMSASQTQGILGKPTSIDRSIPSLLTLFYRGNVPGSGFVSGNIQLKDDQVYLVSMPVFLEAHY